MCVCKGGKTPPPGVCGCPCPPSIIPPPKPHVCVCVCVCVLCVCVFVCVCVCVCVCMGGKTPPGEGVAQLVEHRSRDPMAQGLTPPPLSKMLCQLIVGVPNSCVYMHAHIKDPMIHVRVWWITETRKDPACAFRTG